MLGAQMVVQVWDHDRFTSDDLLGTVRFPMTDAFHLPPDKVRLSPPSLPPSPLLLDVYPLQPSGADGSQQSASQPVW